jgi:hypothetical protein
VKADGMRTTGNCSHLSIHADNGKAVENVNVLLCLLPQTECSFTQ